MFGPKLSAQKLSEPNASQRVRGKCCSGQRVRAFRKKSRTFWPQLPQWRTFAKLKPKGTRKMLFGLKGSCIAQKVTYPLAPTATMDVCQFQAKGYEENAVRAKQYVHFGKSHEPVGPNSTFPVRAKGYSCFSFEPHLTGKKKLAPKLSVRTTGARSPGVPVRASKLNFG